jgi:hypothetical protein
MRFFPPLCTSFGLLAFLAAGFTICSGCLRSTVELRDQSAEVVAHRIHSDIKPPPTAQSVYLMQGGAKDLYVFLRFSAPREVLAAWWSKARSTREFEEASFPEERFYDAPEWFDTERIENGERYVCERHGVREEVYLDQARHRAYYMFLTW